MKVLNLIFLAIFLLCAAVQWNDPDPYRWIAIYGAAAFCCFFYFRRKLPAYLPAVTAIVAFLWILLLIPVVWGQQIAWHQVFATIHMLSPGVEEIREIGGLFLVLIWMMVLAYKTRSFMQPSIR